MMLRYISVVFVALVIFIGAAGVAAGQTLPWREGQEPVRETTTITVGEHELEVELSISATQQSLGLGYRNELHDGRGMLFVSDEASERTFWMKGMRFCIDIVWIEGGEIIGAAESVCPDPPGTADADRARYGSGEPVDYVLEVPVGWLEEHGYGPGTPVEIPESVHDIET